MRNATVALLTALGSLLIGCTSPGEKSTVNLQEALEGIETGLSLGGTQLRAGMVRQDVLALAGEPLAKEDGNLPDGPFWGPQEGLDPTLLDASRTYEEWRYEHEGNVYYLWFGDPKLPKPEWRIVAVASYPEGSAF